MAASSSRTSDYDDETSVLGGLLDIFGSVFSLREIASAFCKAGHNAELAAEILSKPRECTSSAATTHISNCESRGAEMLSKNTTNNLTGVDRNSRASKPKKNSVSVGTVSSILGKGYSKPATSANLLSETTKPMKVNLKEFQISEDRGKGVLLESTAKAGPINSDVEEFLFKMLGDGFKLGMGVIRDVLGSCGYDANKSIDKLIDLSASTLKKSDDIVGGLAEKSTEKNSKQVYPSRKEKLHHKDFAQRNGSDSTVQEKERHDLPRELLTSLFTAPDRPEEPPRRFPLVRAVKKTRSFGTVVSEPLIDTTREILTCTVDPQQDTDDEVEEEDSYQVLRRAAKEHWVTMKEYYKDAIDAFAKGNHTLADKFLQQGQFFNNKAREADERSSQKIFECSKKEIRDEVTLDLHDYGAKEAIRLLKFHLTSLSGIHSIQNLKVILENDAEDITKGSRKRRVLKLLERESIKWTEEGNGGTIIIELVEIDPEQLSFSKKSEDN